MRRRIELGLKAGVYVVHAESSFFHWHEHLNVFQRIARAELGSGRTQRFHAFEYALDIIAFLKHEVVRLSVKVGQFPLVYEVGVCDYHAAVALPEYFVETYRFNNAALDYVAQHIACTD